MRDIIYNTQKIKELFFTNKKVEFDVLINELNEIFNGEISFDIEHIDRTIYKYKLLTPINTFCMMFSINSQETDGEKISEEINKKGEECLMCLVKKYIAVIPQNSGIAITKEPKKEQSENQNKPADTATPTEDNKITQEQIDFINNFKEEFKIDTDEKFNSYIETWNSQAKTSVKNKYDLARAGRKVVDSFISWVKSFKEEEQTSSDFIIPSSEEVGFPW